MNSRAPKTKKKVIKRMKLKENESGKNIIISKTFARPSTTREEVLHEEGAAGLSWGLGR